MNRSNAPTPKLMTLLALALAFLVAPASGQRNDDLPSNHPSTDPYTHGDPDAMKLAGVVALGGFEFSTTDTREVDSFLAEADIRWVETEHFELGFALGPYRVRQEEKKAIRAELTALQEKYPEIDPKTKVLDPWLRAHMYAQRAERVYQRFVELAGIDTSVFPTGARQWTGTGVYWGEGPYLGQKGKYEILILASEGSHLRFLTKYYGLKIKRAQRWNVIPRDTLTINMHAGEEGMKYEAATYNLMAANITHILLNGFRHYSYDTPVWLHEGLAHFVVREIDPRFNVFDASEGAVATKTKKSDWGPEVKKIISSGDVPSMARLSRLRDFAELELPDHYATWAIVDYLHQEHPEALGKLIHGLKGITDEQGLPDGSDLPEVQRNLFRELFGMSYPQFDATWQEWARTHY